MRFFALAAIAAVATAVSVEKTIPESNELAEIVEPADESQAVELAEGEEPASDDELLEKPEDVSEVQEAVDAEDRSKRVAYYVN